MEEIKILLNSLEKEGLYEGKVLFEKTEYLFRDGLLSVNPAIDMKGLSQDKKEEQLTQMTDKHTGEEARVVDTEKAQRKIKRLKSIKEIFSQIKAKDRQLLKAATVAPVFIIAIIVIAIIINFDKDQQSGKVVDNSTGNKNFLNNSIEAFRGVYSNALRYLKEAGESIIAAKEQEDRKQEEKPNNNKKPLPQKNIINIKFTNLPPGFRSQYLEELKSIKIPDLKEGVKVRGQISLIIKVDDKGKIFLQTFDDRYLMVAPEKEKPAIKNRIYQEIASIALPPPTDTMEKPVIVYPWRLTYRIGTYKTKIILTKLF